MAHMRKNHQDAPKIQSPLGSFPSSNSATVLQFDDGEAATQGNSNGDVNSPKVVTSATYVCAVCEIHFQKKEEVADHMDKEHVTVSQQPQDPNDNDEALNEADTENDTEHDAEAEEDQWLYDALDNIGEVYDVPEKEDEAEILKEKIERIKAVVRKKAEIIKDMIEKNELLQSKNESYRAQEGDLKEKIDTLEASGSYCHECTSKDEVIINKEALLVKKEKETEDEKRKKLDVKKQLENQRKFVNGLKEKYEKVVEENNGLKNTIDEQADNIKHLEEQCGIDENEEDIEEVSMERNLMNKNQSGHLCVTCTQKFTTNNGLEKHMKDKHTEFVCDYCDDVFRTKREFERHMAQCEELGLEAVECNNKKKLVRWGSKKHKCQPTKKTIACTTCERIFKTIPEMKKHKANEHRAQEKSMIICRFYRQGNCLNGDSCQFSHAGFVRNNCQTSPTSKSTPKSSTCRHGDNCAWLAKGTCSFYHRGVGVQKPHQQNKHSPKHQQNDHPNPLRCPRGPSCIHLSRGACNYGGVYYHVQQKEQEEKEQEKEQLCCRVA